MYHASTLTLVALMTLSSAARAGAPSDALQLETYEPKSETTALVTALITTTSLILGGSLVIALSSNVRNSDGTALAITGRTIKTLGNLSGGKSSPTRRAAPTGPQRMRPWMNWGRLRPRPSRQC